MKSNRVRLQYQLILSYLVIILIPLVALGAISFYVSQSIVQSQTLKQDETYLRQISHNVDNVVSHMKSTSLIAYSSTLLQQYIQEEDVDNLELKGDANIHNYLYSLKSADYNNYTFILKSYTSDSIYCNNYDYGIDYDYSFDELYWVQNAKSANGNTVFVPTYIPDYYSANRDPVFSIVRQLNNNYTLSPIGYIIINCNARVLDEIIGDSTVYIYDHFDRLVFPYGSYTMPDLPDIEEGRVVTFNGNQVLMSELSSDSSGLRYVKLTPYSDITRNSSLILQLTAITIILAIALTLMVSVPLARNIATPINRLILNMNSVKNDDFEESIVTTNVEEIHELNDHFNHMINRINDHIQLEYTSKIRKKDIEYKLLQSQISPHFLFNTLESIRMMAALNDDSETAQMIFSLANLYRYSIRITESLVPLKSELDHINNYVALQKMRFGDKFDYIEAIDPSTLHCQMPHLTLQPIIENAINHGFAATDRGGIIKLTSSYKENTLTIIISDNGKGMDQYTLNRIKNQLGKQENQGHIGLLATCERIKHHFEHSDIHIDSDESWGTQITMVIDYN